MFRARVVVLLSVVSVIRKLLRRVSWAGIIPAHEQIGLRTDLSGLCGKSFHFAQFSGPFSAQNNQLPERD